MNDSAQLLRSVHLRATPQRVKVLAALAGAHTPKTAEELMVLTKGAIELTTMYRSLAELVRVGLATKRSMPDGAARYEAAGSHHHHVVCRDCGALRDLTECLPQAFLKKLERSTGFSHIDGNSLALVGLCRKCV